MWVVAVLAVGLAVLRLPGMIGLVFIIAVVGVVIVNGFISLMFLGWLGFGLLALGDWLIARIQRVGHWPEEDENQRGL